jgi:LmbE family N-acetylglucosaminyl deacetylase
MINVELSRNGESFKILFLGAHPDDIEIGCGGTVLKLMEKYKTSFAYWVVFSSSENRRQEAEESANAFLADAEDRVVIIKSFRDGYFPYIGREIKEYFEELKRDINPDLIFTHYRSDLHQDHRLVSELTWNTFRDHVILEYEIPKYDGDLGHPNIFIHLDESFCRTKVRYIMEHFKTQKDNQWFTEETFQALMRLRGIESNSPSRYAEAFYCRKLAIVV